MSPYRLYIARIVFKHLDHPQDYILFTYCIDAINYKEAYQRALIVASEQFAELNKKSRYSFVGLQELTLLNSIQSENQRSLISDNVSDVDEDALKTYHDQLILKLSDLSV